jgi:hypothetical protein
MKRRQTRNSINLLKFIDGGDREGKAEGSHRET